MLPTLLTQNTIMVNQMCRRVLSGNVGLLTKSYFQAAASLAPVPKVQNPLAYEAHHGLCKRIFHPAYSLYQPLQV